MLISRSLLFLGLRAGGKMDEFPAKEDPPIEDFLLPNALLKPGDSLLNYWFIFLVMSLLILGFIILFRNLSLISGERSSRKS